MTWRSIETAPRDRLIEARRRMGGRVVWQGAARWGIWYPPRSRALGEACWILGDLKSKAPRPTEWRDAT